ncbi:HAMP domain-containing sensor histidine kinase [Caulobacter segnis]|uniref:sensor histidine kinase n=1 Tax=Caulobacter segnis TaxID=88688 RepID=UPI00240FFA4E|nr:HAMP domain-containing sensor histidine kinase [Caulobacter segnis]MDG2522036.1 HAMP domain-containing sensor histidine kinase [Caulobacter segnis]
MLRDDDELRRGLAASAHERLKQAPVRLSTLIAMSWAFYELGEVRFIIPWLVANVIGQTIEFFVMRPFRLNPAKAGNSIGGRMAALTVITFLPVIGCTAIYYLWTRGDLTSVTMSLLLLTGVVLVNATSALESRAVFYVGAAPFVLTTIAMIVHSAINKQGSLAILVVCFGLFLSGAHAAWERVYRARKAELAARQEAEARRREAEEAVANRAAMAAIVSQELRSPLATVTAGASLIEEGVAPHKTISAARTITDAARLMGKLLDDLLDRSKVEARAMALDVRDFELVGSMVDVARFWQTAAHAKGLEFEAPDIASGPIWVQGDPNRLRQILNNFLSNAIKFTDRGRVALRLSVQREGGLKQVRIDVVDDGPGVPPDAVERLFTPYVQGAARTAKTYGGTGLGLAVSRDLAELMGGRVQARAGTPRGSVFSLILPMPVGTATIVLAE